MPGIVDGDFHGTRPTDCDMGCSGGTVAQVLAKLQACLDRPDQIALKGSNVRMSAGHLFGESNLPSGTPLTRYDLDRLDTTRPISVENLDGHKFWMNSKAIVNAGIGESTPDPPKGEIGRDANRKWVVMRYFGLEGIRARLREHLRLARLFTDWVDEDPEVRHAWGRIRELARGLAGGAQW